ncbi:MULTISPECIES: 3-deoxy-7-phosphoheptulonate synthase class II [Streptomycetaceae]|uniref:Phospho-2-dehydro-3-deoxyheptonate aldolase n=1 Tax=Streptantibioticus cattleyicolor (strain ATCC 35852 / DSM 46488 / JCM 4925 / NBRC 14057 / NRRL 8057) TaxID=1003195 RepID=F8JQL1_STREN|nr:MULTISPECIES: 3-deoxy-7-phosphoheptulonate synthase class II [Streptomycetaceae]AEW97858.1 phospho-2-dehydro-3-deoxyheptonate aldolase [Streptantibioticus cattleyicolor NRRL 8057 = DSM 46488]MYS62272.1 3-deoxy-7-phosphoheptulonate synthase [Streptomyces sp. SID5468]CCB78177.1 Phospho-2-dehydro-3-deoxyheptonate aldolase [Streptantibioticus cattleyicolor NRRL 8057 = DSM 46488]
MILTETPPGTPPTTPGAPSATIPPAANWRTLPAVQQPTWSDPALAARVMDHLALQPSLTAPADVRRLGAALAHVSAGRAFLVQAGDCAEPVGAAGLAAVRGKHRVIGEMAEIISSAWNAPTVTVGRIAGQYAKPRSQPQETVDGRTLPVFRGSMVNAPEPDPAARRHDPRRMLTAYHTARGVLGELHLIAHETASGQLSELWAPDAEPWTGQLPTRPWDGTLRSIVRDYGQTRRTDGTWRRTGMWTSHEALVLDYEQAFVRLDPFTGEHYLLSTHQPWIGERTRQTDGAHVAFAARIANPVGLKVGPDADPATVVELCRRLDPHRRPGRLTLITRMGAARVRDRLPRIVRAVEEAGHEVVWACDPMHGNTVTEGGRKTRHLSAVHDEIRGFFEVLRRAGQWPGGVHLEVAGDHVTECLGDHGPKDAAGLARAYRTLCDPRLNDDQARATAGLIADLIARG